MAVRYRKSFKAGPFRVTASKTEIRYSASAGVKGAGITKRADGRRQSTLSARRTGMSSRRNVPGSNASGAVFFYL
jgi:hypothetical protein